MNLINYYKDDISLITGAHIHRNEIRSSQSEVFKDLKIPILITQSVTPVYMNNPAYTTLNVIQENEKKN